MSYPSPEALTLPLSLTMQARYVSLVPEDCLLEDQRGAQWPLDAGVMREVQRSTRDARRSALEFERKSEAGNACFHQNFHHFVRSL